MSHLAGHVAKLNSKSGEIDSLLMGGSILPQGGEGFDAIFTIYYRTLGCWEGCRLERKEERGLEKGKGKDDLCLLQSFSWDCP